MTPRTEAGRALVDEWYPGDGDGLDSIALQDFRAAVLAIEAEMLALVRRAALSERLMLREHLGAGPDEHVGIPAEVILVILDELAE